MTSNSCLALLTGMLLVATADAAESSAAEALIAPDQVTLGMSLASLKAVRPKVFDGPEASRPNDPQQRKWPTMMEIVDLGQPSQVSFWYLFSNDKLTGLLRTRNLVLVPPERRNVQASSLYAGFARLLGVPRQESLLRKGDVSFVPVRADVWTDDATQRIFYFIATTKEITTAVVASSDFPMEQVLIRPDPKRFEIADKAAQTVADLPRSAPLGGDAAPENNKTPALSFPSLSQPKQGSPKPFVNSPKPEQPKEDEWSLGLWVLMIAFALATLWIMWRAISKSQQGETK